mgnify:CR=1 FL=1
MTTRVALATAMAAVLAAGAPIATAQDADPERPEPAAAEAQADARNGGAREGRIGGVERTIENDVERWSPFVEGAEVGDSGDAAVRLAPEPKGMVRLAMQDIAVEELFPLIAEETGKVVMPINLIALRNKKITLLNDRAIPRREALDLIFQAFRNNGVGIIEKKDVILIGLIDELMQFGQLPVVPADESVMGRMDKGSLVVKIFRLDEAPAEEVHERITENLPSYATVTVDVNSNQIMVMGDIALAQHMTEVITALDHNYLQTETVTFRLAHADANEIANQSLELYEEDGSTQGATTSRARNIRGRRAVAAGQAGSATSGPGPTVPLKVTVNVPTNSVTVVGDPAVIEEVRRLINEEWDLPRSPGTTKIYTLRYTDPIVIAEVLNELMGGGSGGAPRRTGARGGGGPADVQDVLSGIYRIDALPDSGQLLVFSKTAESLDFLTEIIESLDQPTSVGLPFVVELKHASAIELAEQINALLAEPGAGATIRAPDEGLTGATLEDTAAGTTGTTGNQAGTAGQLQFPWQRGGRQRDDRSPESPLIGKIRIVPIVRQNALAVLAPRPYEESVRELITFFDRPGRQVMLSVIIAEVELGDNLTLGLRFSSSQDILGGTNPDFRVGGSFGFEGQEEGFLDNLFDTSVLNANVSLNAVIQALSEETNLRILQQPTIFTADNQEAYFFDGQDIPFITETVINSQGNPTDSFEYRQVGVILNARPRITVERDVDLELRLELSAVVPGQTLFGGAIVDKRQTSTHVIVKNGQTVVLSGILKESETKITRKIPLLGDIPIVGELFKHRENNTTRSELIAFITPRVVDAPEDMNTNFQNDAAEYLEQLIRPMDEAVERLKEDPDRVRNRFSPSRTKDDPYRQRNEDAEPDPPFVDVDEIERGQTQQDQQDD